MPPRKRPNTTGKGMSSDPTIDNYFVKKKGSLSQGIDKVKRATPKSKRR